MTASGANCDIRPDEKYFDKNLLSVEVSLGKPRLYVNEIGTKIWFELRLLRIEVLHFC